QLAGGEPFGKWDGIGNETLANYARQFGLGAVTGLGLPGEIPGLVPDARWKQRAIPGEPWLKGNTYTYGIGQSYLQTTPIQMPDARVAVLNDGVLLRPHIVKEKRDAGGRAVWSMRPEVMRQVVDSRGAPIDPRWYEIVRRGIYAGMAANGQTENGAKYTGTSY